MKGMNIDKYSKIINILLLNDIEIFGTAKQ